MSTFDPMASTIDWLDSYRAASLSIVEMYADDALLECGCDGWKVIGGREALTEYWRERFVRKPAGELEDIQPDGPAVVVGYRTPSGVVQAVLSFNDEGKIQRCYCGSAAKDSCEDRR